MSYESKKGYRGERAVELMWHDRGRPVMRPRAGAAQDIGDLVGLPVLQSVKNHRALALASWVDDMRVQMGHAGMDVGVVWHKRVRQGDPLRWYVTTDGEVAVRLLETYCDAVAGK